MPKMPAMDCHECGMLVQLELSSDSMAEVYETHSIPDKLDQCKQSGQPAKRGKATDQQVRCPVCNAEVYVAAHGEQLRITEHCIAGTVDDTCKGSNKVFGKKPPKEQPSIVDCPKCGRSAVSIIWHEDWAFYERHYALAKDGDCELSLTNTADPTQYLAEAVAKRYQKKEAKKVICPVCNEEAALKRHPLNGNLCFVKHANKGMPFTCKGTGKYYEGEKKQVDIYSRCPRCNHKCQLIWTESEDIPHLPYHNDGCPGGLHLIRPKKKWTRCPGCEYAVELNKHQGLLFFIEHAYDGVRCSHARSEFKGTPYEPKAEPEDTLRPSHYLGKDHPYEVIKVIRAWDLNFELGNAVKYIARAGKKDESKTIEDLNKAVTYIQMEIERREASG